MFDKHGSYGASSKDKGKEGVARNVRSVEGMDPRYWKEFENMGEMGEEKRSGSEEGSPRYRRRSHSRSRSRSRSSSSSSSASSSSSSSSRYHSDRSRGSYRKREPGAYRRNSPSRGTVRSNSYGSVSRGEETSNWFPPPHPGYPPQSQDLPPSSSFNMPPNQYPQGPPPPVQGQYPPNFQGQNFGNNYFGFDQPPHPGFYPPNFHPQGSQPPPNFPMGGGPPPGQGPPGPGNWDPMFPDTTLPPPIMTGDGMPGPPPMGGPDKKFEEARKEAIEQELLQQKRTLSKQREDYVRRKFSLNRELSRLKDQKRDLLKEKSKENERILRENAKLQGEILQKLKSIDNVIEMLTNIIGDGTHLPEIIKEIKQVEKEKVDKIEEKSKKVEEKIKKAGKKAEEKIKKAEEKIKKAEEKMKKAEEKSKKADQKKPSPERSESRKRSESTEADAAHGSDFSGKNLLYYDPGLHWCADCNEFPKRLSDYLNHLHSEEHAKNSKMKFEEFPWHNSQNREKSPVINKDLPTKRIPIRGVQFLIPATAWFCSMCKVWLGDSHCASRHVQNALHSQNYSDFIAKNPHWEVDWLTERTRSYEKKSEAKHLAEASNAPAPPSVTLESLSDQLLAIIANKTQEQPPPPPPPPAINKSSSSSEDDESPDWKEKRKKKKLKTKKVIKESSRSPSKEKLALPVLPDQLNLNKPVVPERRPDRIPVDDKFISEWMPKIEAREIVPLKKKPKIDSEKVKTKSVSRERSIEKEPYNDHDDAVTFDKRVHPDKDSRNKRKHEEDKYERYSKYERGSPKDKYNKYKSDKHRSEREEEYRSKKDPRYQRDNERDRMKKSPFSRMKDIIDKKKPKNKVEKTSDDDAQETAFEKRSSELAAKKKIDGKKVILNTLPKTKLPFIGRMPILKKKVEQKSEEKEEKKDDEGMKDIPEALLPTDSLPMDSGSTTIDQSIAELPKSTLIISKRPRLPEPGIVKKEILFNKPVNDNFTEQDMELDDEAVVAPKEEEPEPPKDELHKDFKDALDLLFPEEKKKDEDEDKEKAAEPEVKVEGQPAALPTGYVIPPGYDATTMYPPYYDQQAYVQQQWVQMGYEQPAQYQGAYPAFPPAVIEQPPVTAVPPPEPEQKKKKNRPSQRMRRYMMKKKIKEMDKGTEDGRAKSSDENNLDDSENDEAPENGEEDKSSPEDNEAKPEPQKPPPDMSDLAMLGIDEDDAAAMGFC